MKKILFLTLVALAATTVQKSDTEKSDPSKVTRVQTLMNHLSVIELAEPVTEVAAGSSAYKVEWRGNKVFVQPVEPDATTNLLVWTASERLNYEPAAVSTAADAEFAIDQEPGKAATPPPPPSPLAIDPVVAEQAKLASQMLFASSPARLSGALKPGRVRVLIKNVYRSEKNSTSGNLVARGRGGSDGISNLTLACPDCNRAKDKWDVVEFVTDQYGSSAFQLKLRLLAGRSSHQRARWAVLRVLKTSGSPVEVGAGGQTKFHRSQLGLPKAHWVDAACVEESGLTAKVNAGPKALSIQACGHGSRQMHTTNEYGFPIRHRTTQKRHFDFQTGDIVRAVAPRGKKVGVYHGRAICRAHGSFDIQDRKRSG